MRYNRMKRKVKKNQTAVGEKREVKKYTIEELLEMGNKTNKIEIAPNMLEKKSKYPG